MKHYGDITKISGYRVPSVNVVIGGSPCQDLSVAGKRAGLAGYAACGGELERAEEATRNEGDERT